MDASKNKYRIQDDEGVWHILEGTDPFTVAQTYLDMRPDRLEIIELEVIEIENKRKHKITVIPELVYRVASYEELEDDSIPDEIA